MKAITLYTVGHGTRTVEELVALLGEGPADTLVDVRRYPGSRRSPHLARDALAASLPRLGVAYLSVRLIDMVRKDGQVTEREVLRLRQLGGELGIAPAAVDLMIAK